MTKKNIIDELKEEFGTYRRLAAASAVAVREIAKQIGVKKMTATFRGQRPFPLEMLSVDQCFPSQNEDIIEILQSIKRDGNATKEYTVSLSKFSDREWNVDKWRTLGWKLEKLNLG